ncbi:hypothetical protein PX554_20545 [Sphingomonas sp. H39-1-10]|uniref:hypothetical protein n=1 Tax=Sphingomonas pollutisoli TaxID=3030829 RepID=UPI0023B9204C|nr:hypothetical protein [Sphingomonas pollutisoli]MDF0490524.1 hypothetical protein [Sphingomonas pollutisoli]
MADRSFFRVFDLLVASANPNGSAKRTSWKIAGTVWNRERHSFSGASHSFSMETILVEHDAAPNWSLLIVKEYWWLGAQDKPLRDLRWAKIVSGSSQAALKWFKARGEI